MRVREGILAPAKHCSQSSGTQSPADRDYTHTSDSAEDMRIIVLVILAATGLAQQVSTSQPKDAPGARVVEMTPGLRIDWEHLIVQVDARVVLREGSLELFACLPRTKEHESIVTVVPSALHIYQALSLVGLQPGCPPSYDPETGVATLAAGQPLDVRVQVLHKGKVRVVPVEDWMQGAEGQAVGDKLCWVFCGSRRDERGEFAADQEGTVISVVEFRSSLIGPAVSYSSDNDQLWLTARTDAIPPVGTPCVLLISALPAKLELQVGSDGSLLHNAQPTGDLSKLLRSVRAKRGCITLQPRPGAKVEVLKSAAQVLQANGVPRGLIWVDSEGKAPSAGRGG